VRGAVAAIISFSLKQCALRHFMSKPGCPVARIPGFPLIDLLVVIALTPAAAIPRLLDSALDWAIPWQFVVD
jgi:hypothetical protein